MLAKAATMVRQHGWLVVNIDCVVLAERPKLLPHREAMRSRIAQILSLSPGQIGLKGKTGEKSGEVGQGQIMQAMCVSLLQASQL